ncbi:MAG TPA: glycosyltransferase [Candidatus Dormibacteraeota bacterium]|nr:glycosyltransferase [Candidatus Dormibacteraeota bacterium]HVC38458.1 glycosyltransferase [Candidatus Dormibacteraeota bacterium]
MARILIVANDVVASRMAGPGIRCFELARQLRIAGHLVTVAGIEASDLVTSRVVMVPQLSAGGMDRLAGEQDAVLLEGFALVRYPRLRDLQVPVIVDLYDPFPLALLQQEAHRPMAERGAETVRVRRALIDLLERGDFFLCASERQRDLWTGTLLSAGRINPKTWDADSSLRALIDVVPFGVSDAPSPPREQSSRAAMGPQVSEDDLVLLWGGGIYNWFDPLTLIKAVAALAPDLPRLKLVFMSMTHPQPGVPHRMWMPARARELSDQLGVTGEHVVFHEGWVPYDERGGWLAAADAGISTHFDHAETRYAFRTRMLDYLWAGLPIICTDGDFFADLVRDRDLGWVVPAEDERALAAAIRALAQAGPELAAIRGNVRRVGAEMTWSHAAVPLLRFCAALRRAPDLPLVRSGQTVRGSSSGSLPGARVELLRKGWRSLRAEGPAVTARKVTRWWSERSRCRERSKP